MNILPFVFSILLILTYGFSASLQTRISSRINQKAYIGLSKASLGVLRKGERQQYKIFPGIERQKKKTVREEILEKNPKPIEPPLFNPPCARLNLFPLLLFNKEDQPSLYETAAKLLRLFYPEQMAEKGLEYKLLDTLILSAKTTGINPLSIPLEIIQLKDPSLQFLYYTLLKGTKKSYPPLLDYFKFERINQPLCLYEAHPRMLAVFFGPKAASKIFQELHQNFKTGITLDEILRLAGDPHLSLVPQTTWDLLCFQPLTHENQKQATFIAEDSDSHISFRQNFSFRN